MLRPGIVSLCGREGGAFEGASWQAGKLTRGDPGMAASTRDMMGSGRYQSFLIPKPPSTFVFSISLVRVTA